MRHRLSCDALESALEDEKCFIAVMLQLTRWTFPDDDDDDDYDDDDDVPPTKYDFIITF
jgi:hypothetical protein